MILSAWEKQLEETPGSAAAEMLGPAADGKKEEMVDWFSQANGVKMTVSI